MSGKLFFKKIVCMIFAIVVGMATSSSTLAIDEDTLDFYAQNNITGYDGDEIGECAAGQIDGDSVSVIGDSISYGAISEYKAQIPSADLEQKNYNGVVYEQVQVSKHFAADADSNYSGMTIARVMQEQGDLRSIVVFALGTNDPGAVTEAAIDNLMNLIGANHKIVLVTNYAYDNKLDYTTNNNAIRAAGQKYNNVAVADWATEVAKNQGKYIGDEYVHPNEEGSKLFVSLIKQALNSLINGSGGGISIGNNKNYAGAKVWSDPELRMIEENRSIYEKAAKQYNFPWQVMAVLHSNETSLVRYNPSNGQGVYQLYSYTDGGTNGNRFEPASTITEEEFERQTIIAAGIVSTMAGDLNNPDNVKKLFFRYNGTAQVYIDKAKAMGFSDEQAQNGEGSAYVMNRYDARRDPTSASMDANWPGRYVADGKYDENSTSTGFGAYVKYEALTGTSSCGYRGGSIAETAINISWPGLNSHNKNDPKPEYVAAMKDVNAYQRGARVLSDGSLYYYPYGASCDQFVGTVMRASGADAEFPVFGPAVQKKHMDDRPEMYTKVNTTNLEDLQPGDIFVTTHNGSHIYLYVGKIDGKHYQASASADDRTGEHFPYVYFTDSYGNSGDGTRVYEVYRRIN